MTRENTMSDVVWAMERVRLATLACASRSRRGDRLEHAWSELKRAESLCSQSPRGFMLEELVSRVR